MKPVIVTAALTGVLQKREHCPYLPYSPEEIAEEARRAAEAGATIVHIHARNEDGSASWDAGVFADIARRVRERAKVVLNFSTGGIGNTIQERAAHVEAAHPEMAALNMGSMNYAIWSRSQKKFLMESIFKNPFRDIEWLMGHLQQHGVVPEMECFDAGHICNARPFIDAGLLKPPYHYSFILGVTGGISDEPENLPFMRRLLPEGAHWQVIGIGKKQWQLLDASLPLGGDLRVGLEDNFYLPNGEMAKSNGELVEAAMQLLQQHGLQAASLDETLAALGRTALTV